MKGRKVKQTSSGSLQLNSNANAKFLYASLESTEETTERCCINVVKWTSITKIEDSRALLPADTLRNS
jgi:hypothetical protein